MEQVNTAAKPTAAHTPGPLALTKIASPIYGSNGSMVAEGVGIGAMNSVYVATVTGRKRDADAERLVACWNACEGMSDPAVEISALRSRSNGVPAMCAEVESLRAEVERLRAALQDLAGWANLSADDPRWDNLGGRVIAALASAAKAA